MKLMLSRDLLATEKKQKHLETDATSMEANLC